MSELQQRHCKPCEGGVEAYDAARVEQMMGELDKAWEADGEKRTISRTFRLKDYYQTIAFVNAVAWIAHREDHHPDLEVGYNRCIVRYSTHAIGGLSENDFICAAKVDALTRE